MKFLIIKVLFTVAAIGFVGCGDMNDYQEQGSTVARAISTGGSNVGKACRVTKGLNKGKTGTYDDEGWCMGDWGGTDCRGNRCEDARVVRPRRGGVMIGVGGVKR